MSILWIAGGLSLVLLVVSDIVGSILGDDGRGGLVTGPLGRGIWRSLESSRRRGRHRPSHLVGRLIVLAVPSFWLFTMWGAWTLVFNAGTANVVASSDQTPASVSEKLYFVGYALSTLGNGEFQPSGAVWQMVTVMASISGFAVLTLGVTYIVPVVQAATTRRYTAAVIALHGSTIDELRESLESGDIDQNEIAQDIETLNEKHGAFPVLHFLHAHEATRSAPAMIALLALAAEPVETSSALDRALERYARFHPGARDVADHSTWIDVLRSDGREAPDQH